MHLSWTQLVVVAGLRRYRLFCCFYCNTLGVASVVVVITISVKLANFGRNVFFCCVLLSFLNTFVTVARDCCVDTQDCDLHLRGDLFKGQTFFTMQMTSDLGDGTPVCSNPQIILILNIFYVSLHDLYIKMLLYLYLNKFQWTVCLILPPATTYKGR